MIAVGGALPSSFAKMGFLRLMMIVHSDAKLAAGWKVHQEEHGQGRVSAGLGAKVEGTRNLEAENERLKAEIDELREAHTKEVAELRRRIPRDRRDATSTSTDE